MSKRTIKKFRHRADKSQPLSFKEKVKLGIENSKKETSNVIATSESHVHDENCSH